ncbi:1,4-dihydroxy-2-naphthoate octaprenyltransferase [Pilibacter termitis]|uniref:1,4-dihydroxy-2-naphthoate octaprenyltransferase n=1 Tax=Pilibacter termitis TaxID=263852 RepID=A0A1T4RDU5_9ENTE|nr:prenyltransferase [Pilibacter termitis]SKA14200.1 1,4-dihydroxy-2-naphthoate octaprenyltransferase [Pilibacter termitis]
MSWKVFCELVEMKAKTASVFPFLLGMGYSWYAYQQLNVVPLLIYFVAMFLFNCFVDAWDNYNDYHRAVDVEDYKQNTNIIGRENISEYVMRFLLLFLFGVSLVLGVLTSLLTGWAVLFLGIFCYAVGIFYSGGTKPLSSLPLGELFSGLTMGFLIFLICVYINTYQVFEWNSETFFKTFLVSLPNTLLIANLMLANNTCDLEEDERNHRYTIVHYIGKKNALIWWTVANVAVFFLIAQGVFCHILPKMMLANLFMIPFVFQFVKPYLKEQVKQTTFICSVKILALLAFTQSFFLGIGAILAHL